MYRIEFHPFLESGKRTSYKLSLFGVYLLLLRYFKGKRAYSISDITITKFE